MDRKQDPEQFQVTELPVDHDHEHEHWLRQDGASERPLYSFDPYRHKEPPSFDTTAAAILNEAKALTSKTAELCKKVVDHVTVDSATFENIIKPFAEDENDRSGVENRLRFYASTHPVKELREASYAVVELFNNAEAELFSQRNLFSLVYRVLKQARSASPATLDDESFYYLTKFHQRFAVGGCGIVDPDCRGDFVFKKQRIAKVAKQCRKNLANEKTGVWFTANELKDTPASFTSHLMKGGSDTEHAEHLWVPTKVPYSQPVLQLAKDEVVRKKMYYAVMNRLPENVPLHRELVLLRDETARMLGWPNHFALKTSQRLMTVERLLSEVRSALRPVAERSARELQDLKAEEVSGRAEPVDDLKVFFWDKAYYEKKIDDSKKGYDGPPVSEYFELNTTLAKLLEIYEQIFNVKLVPGKDTAASLMDQKLIWHEDVQMFSAWTMDAAEPEFLGYAYLDFFPREGKFTHAGQYSLQRRYQKPDGTWFHPCSCLIMNHRKPAPDNPTLLNLDDVRKLFHELGHMYHCLLSKSRYSRLHSVDSDFVETPSMMLEQFFWDPQIITDVSLHYSYISPAMRQAWLSTRENEKKDASFQPPRHIAREHAVLVEMNENGRRVRSSLNELFFTTYDMLVHSPESHEQLEQTDLAMLYNKTRSEVFCMHGGEALGEGWEYCQGQSVFRAINAKYDAGYYAYILGRLFAINIFEAGFAGDIMNKENGRRYRDMVLCMGGRQPEMKQLTDYLGHEPSSKPYLEWLGMRESAEKA